MTLPDQGAQNERTRLAWSRTSSGAAVTVLLVARVVGDRAVWVATVLLVVGLLAVAALTAGSRRRYRRMTRTLRVGGRGPGAGLLVVTTALVMVLAIAVLARLLARAS